MRAMRVAAAVTMCGVVLAGCDVASSVGGLSARTTAETRVRTVLNGWSVGADGRESDLQTAICQWYRGVNVISDLGELGRAQSAFERWRGEAGYRFEPIQSFEIVGAEVVGEGDPVPVRVEVVIDGRPMAMLVVPRDPIRWAPG